MSDLYAGTTGTVRRMGKEIERLEAIIRDMAGVHAAADKAIERLQARVEDLEGAIKSAHNDLMNLQPHIPQSCYPKHQPFIDTHVDAAMEALAATEQVEPTQCHCGRTLDTVGRCEYHGLPEQER